MKKTYINPSMEIIKIEDASALLAGSLLMNDIDAQQDAMSNELELDGLDVDLEF